MFLSIRYALIIPFVNRFGPDQSGSDNRHFQVSFGRCRTVRTSLCGPVFVVGMTMNHAENRKLARREKQKGQDIGHLGISLIKRAVPQAVQYPPPSMLSTALVASRPP
jgi:hypothetical protein